MIETEPKPVRWVGSSRKDLKTFPKTVQRHIGQALYAAQRGEEYPSVKALKGFGGRSVLEIVAPDDDATYRAIYTGAVCERDLCSACLSEEVEERHRDAEEGNRLVTPATTCR